LVGLRAPNDNNPVYDVTSQDIICQKQGRTSSQIINVKAGDNIGAYFGHVIGGAQSANDPDNPIAPSHKGPITAWLAKVDNAASASKTGLKWFKVSILASLLSFLKCRGGSKSCHYMDFPSL
jgi:cellulase